MKILLNEFENIEGMSEEESKLIAKLLAVWKKKRQRNNIKTEYYDGKIKVKNLGISVPRDLAILSDVVLGWGAKAVDALAVRSRFDGFVYEGLNEDPLNDALRRNNFSELYRQAVLSELTNSCAFITVGAGMDGEPDVIINAYAANRGAAIWNARNKCIDAGIVITEVGEKVKSEPEAIILYTKDSAIECKRTNEKWASTRTDYEFGRPLMEALIYKPTLTKPLGTSRISRAVMSIIDRAMRCAVRMDVAAEFFSTPQKYLLGAEEDVLNGMSKWEAYIGYILGIGRDENGELPEFGQLSQMQLTPLTDQMRALAAEFAGETGVPVSSLGVIHDNPASAEAIYAEREDLILEADSLNVTNGNALQNIGLLALAILGGYKTIDAMPNEWKTIMPKFKSTSKLSVVSQSDAIVKQVSAVPWIADTDVALEELGYSVEQITRMKAQRVGTTASMTFKEIADKLAEQTTA